MKLGIIGSRSFDDYEKLSSSIHTYFFGVDACEAERYSFDEIISGGASGADKLGARFAKEHNIKLTEFIPDWDLYGKRAGFIRNEDIVKNSDVILCFWDGISKGAANSLSIAKRLKKTTIIVYF